MFCFAWDSTSLRGVVLIAPSLTLKSTLVCVLRDAATLAITHTLASLVKANNNPPRAQ